MGNRLRLKPLKDRLTKAAKRRRLARIERRREANKEAQGRLLEKLGVKNKVCPDFYMSDRHRIEDCDACNKLRGGK